MAWCGMRDDGTIQPAKVTHFTQQGFTIKGIIHGGANDGEEVYSYQDLGVEHILCFEPLKSAYDELCRLHPDVHNAKLALGDKNGTQILKVTAGDGKGSTLLIPIPEHPEIVKNWRDNADIVGTEKIKVTRLDDYLNRNKDVHPIENYDCLVLDTQGNEWEVLHGCGDYLKDFKFISVELSDVPVYEGEHPGQQVIDYLVEQGFTQDSPLQSHNDVFFVRSDIKPTSDLIYRGLA